MLDFRELPTPIKQPSSIKACKLLSNLGKLSLMIMMLIIIIVIILYLELSIPFCEFFYLVVNYTKISATLVRLLYLK